MCVRLCVCVCVCVHVCVCVCVCVCKGYKCNVYPIQVGSRGYVDMDSFEPLRKFLKVKTKQYLPFLTQLISTTLEY